MQYPTENECDPPFNRKLNQISPTTSTADCSRHDDQIHHKINHMKIALEYPLCSSLLNDHFLHADFLSDFGPYTKNTEWLV